MQILVATVTESRQAFNYGTIRHVACANPQQKTELKPFFLNREFDEYEDLLWIFQFSLKIALKRLENHEFCGAVPKNLYDDFGIDAKARESWTYSKNYSIHAGGDAKGCYNKVPHDDKTMGVWMGEVRANSFKLMQFARDRTHLVFFRWHLNLMTEIKKLTRSSILIHSIFLLYQIHYCFVALFSFFCA